MSQICSNEADISVVPDRDKPSEHHADDHTTSDHVAIKEPETSNENVPEENKNNLPSTKEASNSAPRLKVKRRSGGRSKHRAGRNRRRKWKPFSKLSWIERKKVEERDTRRAVRVRDEMSACGIVLAPYNTTQFIMNDHDVREPDYSHIHNGRKHRDRNDGDSSSEHYSCSDDDDYICKQFTEHYESSRNQYLNSLPDESLVHLCLELEDKIEALEIELAQLRTDRTRLGIGTLDSDAELEKISVFHEEIRKIMIENKELQKQNLELANALSSCS